MRSNERSNPLLVQLGSPPVCPECGAEHWPQQPHDPTTAKYQAEFMKKHGRRPTWRDAVSHCSDELKMLAESVWPMYGIDPEKPAGTDWPALISSGE